jgi:hypothetical protein
MNELNNNIETEDLTPAKKQRKALGVELTDLELAVIARSEDLNIPSLCSMFELHEEQVHEILAKK